MSRQRAGVRFSGLLALAVLGVAGCAGGERPASVYGHVSYKGKPVTSGTVVFVSEDGKSSYPGQVQPDGSYAIAQAPVGEVRLSFDNPPPPRTAPPLGQKPPANDPEYQEAAKAASLYVPTPVHFKDPDKSGIIFDLRRGSNECDIDLK